MERYIDADDFIKLIDALYTEKTEEIQKCYDEPINLQIKWTKDVLVYFVEKTLKRKSSIFMVKCKDCEYWHTEECKMDDFYFSETKETDFCSFGKKKDGD